MATAQVVRLLEDLRIEVDNARGQVIDSNTYYTLVGRLNEALEETSGWQGLQLT
jgi:hypothetical protein